MQPHTVLYGAFSRPISSLLAQLNLLRTLAISIGTINSTKHLAIKKTFRLTHSHALPGSGGGISWPRDVAHGQIPTSKKDSGINKSTEKTIPARILAVACFKDLSHAVFLASGQAAICLMRPLSVHLGEIRSYTSRCERRNYESYSGMCMRCMRFLFRNFRTDFRDPGPEVPRLLRRRLQRNCPRNCLSMRWHLSQIQYSTRPNMTLACSSCARPAKWLLCAQLPVVHSARPETRLTSI